MCYLFNCSLFMFVKKDVHLCLKYKKKKRKTFPMMLRVMTSLKIEAPGKFCLGENNNI